MMFKIGLVAQDITINDLEKFGIEKPLFIIHNNFTDSKLDEYLIGIRRGASTSGLEILQIQDKNLVSRTKIPYSASEIFEKDNFFYPIVTNDKIDLGEFQYYFYINDYNKNGRNEIFLFQLSGIGFSFQINEYNEGKVETLLYGDLYPAYKYSFVTLGDKSIEIVPSQTVERIGDDLYKLKAIKYTWDETENIYKEEGTRFFEAYMPKPPKKLLEPLEEQKEDK